MARNWQLLLLGGALLSPVGAWADKKDGEKQQERWAQDCGGADERGQSGSGVVCAATGFTRIWENMVVAPRASPPDSEPEKEWRKEQTKRERDRRDAWKERERERRAAAREWEKDRRKLQREWEKNAAAADREEQRGR